MSIKNISPNYQYKNKSSKLFQSPTTSSFRNNSMTKLPTISNIQITSVRNSDSKTKSLKTITNVSSFKINGDKTPNEILSPINFSKSYKIKSNKIQSSLNMGYLTGILHKDSNMNINNSNNKSFKSSKKLEKIVSPYKFTSQVKEKPIKIQNLNFMLVSSLVPELVRLCSSMPFTILLARLP